MGGRPCSLILLGVLLFADKPFMGSLTQARSPVAWPPLFLTSFRGFADR